MAQKHFEDLTAKEWDLVKLYLLNYLPTMDRPYSIGRKAMEFADGMIDGINDYLCAKALNENVIATEMAAAENALFGSDHGVRDKFTKWVGHTGPKSFHGQKKFWQAVMARMEKEKLYFDVALKQTLHGQTVAYECDK